LRDIWYRSPLSLDNTHILGSVLREKRSRHVMSALGGLDVHKDSTYATILNNEGKIVNQTRMNNERVLPYLRQFNVCKVGMESSNQIAPLFRQLTSKDLTSWSRIRRRPGTLRG
jgi:hypothetical protein